MVIRSKESYQILLNKLDWIEVAGGRYKAKGNNNEEMCLFIAKKGGEALQWVE